MSNQPTTEKDQLTDPVCDMTVSPDAEYLYLHADKQYFFCSERCLQKFKTHPEQYLEKKTAPPLEKTTGGTYTCPMHPEVIQNHPGSCPKCVMANGTGSLLMRAEKVGAEYFGRRFMKVWTIAMIILLMATTTFSAGPGDVLGPWKTDGGDSWLELFECGEKICGTIVWLKEPTYIDSKDGPVGKSKVDRKNPDPALRNRPILGLQVMNGFTAKGNNRWTNGTCYNPVSGKSYKCKMHLISPHKLELRGYIGISFFGRTFVLTR